MSLDAAIPRRERGNERLERHYLLSVTAVSLSAEKLSGQLNRLVSCVRFSFPAKKERGASLGGMAKTETKSFKTLPCPFSESLS